MAISVVALSFGMSYAYAQAPFIVDFETDPLFSEINILPGDGVSKAVTVSNYSVDSQNIIAEAINAVDDDGLGDVLNLVIKENSTMLYSDTLGNFLRAGEILLSVLPSDETTAYSFSVSFVEGADDTTQSGIIDFDLCVGFEGGNSNCGSTEIGGEDSTDDGGATGSGGGGTISGSGGGGGILNTTRLKIENERTTDVSVAEPAVESTATIEWDTNLLSTSQVIYGPATNGIGGAEIFYSLNLTDLSYFGYPSGTVEDGNKVTAHTVVLTGLVPDQVYKYRVVSRASPPTVSYEHTFVANTQTLAINLPTDNDNGNGDEASANPEIGGLPAGIGGGFIGRSEEGNNSGEIPTTKNIGGREVGTTPPTKETSTAQNNLAASILAFSDFSVQCGLYLFLILALLAVLHRLWNKYLRGEVILNPNEVITRGGLIFWISGLFVSTLTMYGIGYLCVIAPLTASLGILIVWYLTKRYMA